MELRREGGVGKTWMSQDRLILLKNNKLFFSYASPHETVQTYMIVLAAMITPVISWRSPSVGIMVFEHL